MEKENETKTVNDELKELLKNENVFSTLILKEGSIDDLVIGCDKVLTKKIIETILSASS